MHGFPTREPFVSREESRGNSSVCRVNFLSEKKNIYGRINIESMLCGFNLNGLLVISYAISATVFHFKASCCSKRVNNFVLMNTKY